MLSPRFWYLCHLVCAVKRWQCSISFLFVCFHVLNVSKYLMTKKKQQNPWTDQACRVLLCPCISLQRPWACTEFIFILNIICASLETATSAHRCIHREHLSAALQKSFFVKGRAQSCPTALETFQFYFILFLFCNLVVKCLLLHSGGWGNGA